MRRLVLIVLWFTVVGILCVIVLSKYDIAERLQVRPLETIQTESLSGLWFSPRGELVGVGQNGSQLSVRVWSGSAGKLIRERTVRLPAAKNAPNPAYTVSGDASKVAW